MLGIAAGTGRIGYALLEGDQLAAWELSRKASRSAQEASQVTRQWLELLKPEVVVTELLSACTRKRGRTLALIPAIEQTANEMKILTASVERRQRYKNKYEEARALARRFADLKDHVPKPPSIWLPEPRNTIVFEALALALEIKRSDDLH